MAYRITNQALGPVVVVPVLPPGVRLGVTDLGPVWNNRPAPKLIVEEVAPCPSGTDLRGDTGRLYPGAVVLADMTRTTQRLALVLAVIVALVVLVRVTNRHPLGDFDFCSGLVMADCGRLPP